MTRPQLRLMLVDDDPVFRLGLRIWLEQSAQYRVVAEASLAEDALAVLRSRAARAEAEPGVGPIAEDEGQPLPTSQLDLDLIILDLGLGAGNPQQLPGLQLCTEIKRRYPTLPILVLSAQVEPVLEAAARQMGADGFGARGMAVRDLGRLIDQITAPLTEIANLPGALPLAETADAPAPLVNTPPGPLSALRISLRLSSVQQIEAVMATIEAEQRRGRSPLLEEAVLVGRYRELKAARWLIRRILATPRFSDQWQPTVPPPRSSTRLSSSTRARPDDLASSALAAQPGVPASTPRTALATSDRLALQRGDVASALFERVFHKLQGNLDNTSDLPLEIDILRDDKKRELLYLTLRQFEDALDNLRQADIPPGQLSAKTPLVLRDVWEATLTEFFGRYYTLQVDQLEQPVVPVLISEAPVVEAAILDRIPLGPMLLGHLLFQEAMVVDGSAYMALTPAALNRSQELLEHLLIQLANGVVQPLLNRFADVELLKSRLYQRRLMTSRDIERFRNDLSWRYRWDDLINEPRAIFESQYRLLGLTERGIQTQLIYAPRQEELDQLSGLQRTVTLVVEARDAVAPRFRAVISLVGSGLVYVLTDVIGRGIGLIGRGIVRGVGNAWKDPQSKPGRQDSDLN